MSVNAFEPSQASDFGYCGKHTDNVHRFTDGKCLCGQSRAALVMQYTWRRLALLDYLRRLHAKGPIPKGPASV
jgi:hypothetical protein